MAALVHCLDSLPRREFPRLTAPAGHAIDGNTLKYLIENLVRDALAALPAELRPAEAAATAPTIERARDTTHGDFATNAAMHIAKATKRKPREVAQAIVDALPKSDLVSSVEIAGPGFINFFLAPSAYHQ